MATDPSIGSHIPGISGLGLAGLGAIRTLPATLSSLWGVKDKLIDSRNILQQSVCDVCTLGPRGLADDTLPGLHLCQRRLAHLPDTTRGQLVTQDLRDLSPLRDLRPDQLRAVGRLPWPFVRRGDEPGFHRISWAEALALLPPLGDRDPTQVGLVAGGTGLYNEAWFALALAAKVIGTPLVDTLATAHDASTAWSLQRSLGLPAATGCLEDLRSAQLVLLWGSELLDEAPSLARYLGAAKASGARVVILGPSARDDAAIPWSLRSLVDDTMPTRPGGEAALILAALRLLRAPVALPPLQGLLERAAVRVNEADWLATLLRRSQATTSVWGQELGDTGQPHAVEALVALHSHLDTLAGQGGRPGAGLLPIWSLSPGAREVGAAPGRLLPLLERAEAGELHTLLLMAADLPGSLPDPTRVRRALGQVHARVHQLHVLDHSALLPAPPGGFVLLLPSGTLQEDGGLLTSSERRVRYSPAVRGAVGEARPAWRIPLLFAGGLRPKAELPRERASLVRTLVEAHPHAKGCERLSRAGDWHQWGGPRLRLRHTPAPLEPGHTHPLVVRVRPQDPPGRATLSHADAAAIHVGEGDVLVLRTPHGELRTLAHLRRWGRGRVDVGSDALHLLPLEAHPQTAQVLWTHPVVASRG